MINKYGIIFNKMLKEKYPCKHRELLEKGELNSLIYKKQESIVDIVENEEIKLKTQILEVITNMVEDIGKE